ncbi:type II toxin-antitoxin system VapC family toxin [Desulfobacterales bacterium HSG2]|nr:type II toxin-antitoxin system VapC family toxin [Desulfobacterales bacterium HSG2]
MMKLGCVLDSDILIYHLNGELDDAGEHLFLRKVKEGAHISIVSRIEILGWQGHTEDSLKAAHELLRRLTEHPLDAEIAGICISLRQNYRIKLPDAYGSAADDTEYHRF